MSKKCDGSVRARGTVRQAIGRPACGKRWRVALMVIGVGFSARAQAQSVWTGASSDYNLDSNWDSGAGATPVNSGQSATFGATGNAAVSVTLGPITPDSWTFAPDAKSVTISGAAVNFSGAGIVNTANQGQTITIANDLDDTSTVTGAGIAQKGNSTLVLTGTTNFSTFHVIQVSAGTLALAGSGSISNATIRLSNNAVFDISQTTAGASAAIVCVTVGCGTVNLGDQTLNFSGSLQGNYANFTGSGNLVIVNGGAIAVLRGTSSYTGTTTIAQNATLQLDPGSSIASSREVIMAAASSMINSNGSVTFRTLSGVAGSQVNLIGALTITNGGSTFAGDLGASNSSAMSLVKNGTGVFTLSGVNDYQGATTVNGGTLAVDGSIANSSLTTVNAGGTLGGSGIVGNTTINGGTLAPGNASSLLTVQGNLTLTSASSYMVAVSPASAGRVNVTGAATLGSATVNAVFAPGSYVSKQYTIVNATGGIVGTFGAQANTSLPSNFASSLSYDANNAYLNLTLSYALPEFSTLNGNQRAVGATLTSYFDRTGGIPLAFGALNAQGLSQVSGELGSGAQQTAFDAMTQFMGIMTDPFSAGRFDAGQGASGYTDEAMAYAGKRPATDAFAAMTRKAPAMAPAPQERWNVWAAGFGGSRGTDGNAVAGSSSTTSSIYGTAVGADYWFAPGTVAGFSLAGGGTNFAVNGGGSGRSDLFQAGAFVRHSVASAYVTAAAAYGWQHITTDRLVTVTGTDRLRAEFNANSYSGRLEVGNRYATSWVGGLGLTPYAAAQVTAFDLPSYAETANGGVGTFGLTYSGKTVIDTRSELGLRSDKSFALTDAMLTLRGRAAWAHDFNTDRTVSATFQALPGASFTVNGAAQASDAALTSAAAELAWTNGWSAAATFEGEFSKVTASYAGKGVVRYAW